MGEKSVNETHSFKNTWLEKSLSERFELVVMMLASFILAAIILVALLRLLENVYQLVISQLTGKTDFRTFQITFGMLLTLLIAIEFRHSISATLEGKGVLIQVKIVVLIAILALARKFLILDSNSYDAAMVAAYAGVALSLGVVYWLLSRRQTEGKDF